MSYELDRYDDGYTVRHTSTPTGVQVEHRGLTGQEAMAKLTELGESTVDATWAISQADWLHEHGLTNIARDLERAQQRARKGQATSEDLDLFRRELRENRLGERRTIYLIALYAAGQQDEAIEGNLELLARSAEWDEIHAALQLLSEWSPQLYERIATPIIRGHGLDGRGLDEGSIVEIRAWAMMYAGELLSNGHGLALLDEIARVATDPQISERSRTDARNALAFASNRYIGLVNVMCTTISSDEEVRAFVEQVRRAIG